MDPILEYVIENPDYFKWPLEIKQEACQRLAIWITNMSFSTPWTRQEIIDMYLEDGTDVEEFEYCAFVKDVEIFFETKNWNHLVNDCEPSN